MQSLKRKITVAPEKIISSIWAIPQDYDDSERDAADSGTRRRQRHEQPVSVLCARVHGATGNAEREVQLPVQRTRPQGPGSSTCAGKYVANGDRVGPSRRHASPPASIPRRQEPGWTHGFTPGGTGGRVHGLDLSGISSASSNNTERLRAEHLPQIQCPMLFIEGTRDPLCDLTLLDSVLGRLDTPTTLHTIEGGDHSFNVLKRLGRKQESVWEEIVEVMSAWISGLE